MSELDQWRKEIDRIDAQIVKAINERYGLVLKIGEWKRARNLPIYVPEREAALLEKLSAENTTFCLAHPQELWSFCTFIT